MPRRKLLDTARWIVPLLLAPPAGAANQQESERIEAPVPGRRPPKTAVTGAASRKVGSGASL